MIFIFSVDLAISSQNPTFIKQFLSLFWHSVFMHPNYLNSFSSKSIFSKQKPFPGFERKLTSKLSWGKFHILGGLVTKDSTRPGVIGISYPAWSSRRVSLEFPTRPGHHAGCHWNFPPGLVKVIPITIKKSFLLNWHIFHWTTLEIFNRSTQLQ